VKKDKQNKKIIVFEKVGYILFPFIVYYLKRNCRVMYFRVNEKLSRSSVFKKFLDTGRFEKMSSEKMNFKKRPLLYDLALDDIDEVYKGYFEKKRLILSMRKLLKSKMTHVAYKKVLTEKLCDFHMIRMLLVDFVEKCDSAVKVYFMPASTLWMFQLLKKIYPLDKRVRIPFLAYWYQGVLGSIEKIKFIIFLFSFPGWVFLKIKKIILNREKSRHYQLGVRIYNDDFGFRYKYRSVDFLLDGKSLNRHNTLFCIENRISSDYMRRLTEKKYNLVELLDLLRVVDWRFINEILLRKFIPFWAGCVFYSFFAPGFIIRKTMAFLYKYLLWTRFLQMYKVNHYVVLNDHDGAHIIRSILFSQNGIKSIYYAHSSHSIDLFTPSNCDDYRDATVAFLCYDSFISWGNKMTKFELSHPNYIGEYKNLGCLWSETIRNVSENTPLIALENNSIRKIKKMSSKIISVFDTTFLGAYAMLGVDDMRAFYEEILKLLEDYPGIGMILKKKWPWEELVRVLPEAKDIYGQLDAHPRCYSTGNEERDPAEVIAVSDLIVSASFTSTTIEALGARKKAIYFDPGNKFRGSYFDKFPNLVAHSYDELRFLVNYWLYKIKDEDFDCYLDTYVKGELDAHTDGKAITRLRQFLCS
jgi:polysaccharide biosynthesis PFTS motif protein